MIFQEIVDSLDCLSSEEQAALFELIRQPLRLCLG